MRARLSSEDDIEWTITQEQDPENRPYVLSWTWEQHRAAINDNDFVHAIFEIATERLGYFILRIDKVTRSVEITRIVIDKKGRGYGRILLGLIDEWTFVQHQFNRLWLDVKEHNVRAIGLYRSMGFAPVDVTGIGTNNQPPLESFIVMAKCASRSKNCFNLDAVTIAPCLRQHLGRVFNGPFSH
jgi:RimJ/RimL family protein N-acetyltransferase